MTLYNILDSVEDRLLDLHLYIRYFDYSDLEFLGLGADECSQTQSTDFRITSRGTQYEYDQSKQGVPGRVAPLRDGMCH